MVEDCCWAVSSTCSACSAMPLDFSSSPITAARLRKLNIGSRAELDEPAPVSGFSAVPVSNEDDVDEAVDMWRKCDGRDGSVGEGCVNESDSFRLRSCLVDVVVALASTDSISFDAVTEGAEAERSTFFPLSKFVASSPIIDEELLSTRLEVPLLRSARLAWLLL